MIAEVQRTQALFPDRHWEVDASPVQEDCTLPNGSAGVTWVMSVTTTQQGSLAQDISTVVNSWKAKGVPYETLDTRSPSDPIRQIVGYPAGVGSIQFSHTDAKDGISALAQCGTPHA